MTATALKSIPLAELHESAHNPRTIFDAKEMAELAESMRVSGQLTPLLVRPHPNGKGGYEIAAGACRRRVAASAGLTHLDAIVRDLDDATFVEFVNVENRQRNNLHALDEARGFADWMHTAGLKIPEIASRIGLSTKYVYDRIKLLQLIPAAKTLFLAGRFEAGHAILLARLSKEDQARAIGDPSDRHNFSDFRIGGLFQPEHITDEPGLELEAPRKACSVREFQAWINDHVRFVPEKSDLPNLFPETLAALHAAKEEDLKVIKITRDYRVPDDAKDPKERTYGEASWKRADGQEKSKLCEYAVLGIVVAGPGRGDPFKVCVEKKKCEVHWGKERREREQAARQGNGASSWQEQERKRHARYEAEQKAAELERARWKRALPDLVKAVAAKLAVAPAGLDSPIGKMLLRHHRSSAGGGFTPKGKTAEDLVRVLAYQTLAVDALNEWRAPGNAPRELKLLGLDAQAIVDRVAPKEASAVTASTPKTGKKKLAGDVRRAKAKKKAAR